MMPFPEVFDQNEWFVLIVLFLSLVIVYLLPKRMPLSITVLIMIYSFTVARLSDHLLSSPKIDLYNIMDTEKYEFFDLILYLLYAPFGYFFVYIYEKIRVRGYWTVVYILLWSSFGSLFEWVSVYFNIFTYKEWELKYSFTVYVFTQTLTLLLFNYLRKQHQCNTENADINKQVYKK
jgi:hypothetical protein